MKLADHSFKTLYKKQSQSGAWALLCRWAVFCETMCMEIIILKVAEGRP